MPRILSPDPVGLVTIYELTEDRIDSIAEPAEQSASIGLWITGSDTEECLQLYVAFPQLLGQSGTPIVAVP